MTKEIIDDFLNNNEEIKQKIENISVKYCVNDFVLFSESIRDFFKYNKKCEDNHIYGCFFEPREQKLRIDIESVEVRLRAEYMDYIIDIFENADDKQYVFYIVAYHYLTMCEEIAYKYTSNNAVFPYIGKEIAPLAKKRLTELRKIKNDEFQQLIEYFNSEDLDYFNNIFWELRHHHHAVKHFSLITNLTYISPKLSRYYFDYSFIDLLDIFVFRYKAIYIDELLHAYTPTKKRKEIIEGLVEY